MLQERSETLNPGWAREEHFTIFPHSPMFPPLVLVIHFLQYILSEQSRLRKCEC